MRKFRCADTGEANPASPFFSAVTWRGTRAATFRTLVTKIGPKGSPAGHVFAFCFAYCHHMRGAFVVQLGPESNPAEGRFEGWVEEVDSCTELRFRSTEELLKFMGLRLELVRGFRGNTPACGAAGNPPSKTPAPKAKKSK